MVSLFLWLEAPSCTSIGTRGTNKARSSADGRLTVFESEWLYDGEWEEVGVRYE